MPAVVDITFVTDVDDYGRALLAVFHRFGAQIIADSPEAYAIARPIVTAPIGANYSKPGWFRKLTAFVSADRLAGATFPAQADMLNLVLAQHRHENAAYAGFGGR